MQNVNVIRVSQGQRNYDFLSLFVSLMDILPINKVPFAQIREVRIKDKLHFASA
jgi:hypothetical protein